MVIIMKPDATQEQIDHVVERIENAELKTQLNIGEELTVVAVIGDKTRLGDIPIESMAGVLRTQPISAPYKLASRGFHEEPTIVEAGGIKIGGKKIVVMAGPCSVESGEGLKRIAKLVKTAGATFLRGGAFKPRTSPYSFQGLGEEGLKYLREAADENNLLTERGNITIDERTNSLIVHDTEDKIAEIRQLVNSALPGITLPASMEAKLR